MLLDTLSYLPWFYTHSLLVLAKKEENLPSLECLASSAVEATSLAVTKSNKKKTRKTKTPSAPDGKKKYFDSGKLKDPVTGIEIEVDKVFEGMK